MKRMNFAQAGWLAAMLAVSTPVLATEADVAPGAPNSPDSNVSQDGMAWVCEAQCMAVDFDGFRLAILSRSHGVSPRSRRRAFNRALGECQNKARTQGFQVRQAELVTRLAGERTHRHSETHSSTSASQRADAQAWSDYQSGRTTFYSTRFESAQSSANSSSGFEYSSSSHTVENEYGLKVTYDVASPMDDRVCMQERIEDISIPYTGSEDARG